MGVILIENIIVTNKDAPFYSYKERELENKIKHLEFKLKRYQHAISSITPWLSASINDRCCQQYVEACNRCFDVDTQFHNMKDLDEYEYKT